MWIRFPQAGFPEEELARLNRGRYHDLGHACRTAWLAFWLSARWGLGTGMAHLAYQVGLLHDANPRRDGAPPRVFVTLDWMDQNRTVLGRRFGWGETDFAIAQAVIARTDFPFDRVARECGSTRDGRSPVEVYSELLERVPAQRRAETMFLGLMLRFADQASNYSGTFREARLALEGLVEELNRGGLSLSFGELVQTTPGFLSNLGNDLEHDRRLARAHDIHPQSLPDRDRLLALMPTARSRSLERNCHGFRRFIQQSSRDRLHQAV